MGRLEGKSVVITGAGSGIGRAASLLFTKEGAKLIAVDKTDGVKETAKLVSDAGGTVEAVMADGTRVQGETNITGSTGHVTQIHLLPPDAKPLPETLAAIAAADLITIGPGSLYTSLVPNLLVRGIPEAVAASTAVKVFVCNLMTEANESLDLTAADHIRVLNRHAGTRIFDYALLNRTPASAELKAKYAKERASQIVTDVEEIEALGLKAVLGDYLDEEDGVARHATDLVTRDLLQLASKPRPSRARA